MSAAVPLADVMALVLQKQPDRAAAILGNPVGVLVGTVPQEEGRGWSFRTASVRAFHPPPGMGRFTLEMEVWPVGVAGRVTARGRPLLMGRAPNSDVLVNHVSVSKLHARLQVEPDGVRLEDAGGDNGTMLNGRRLPEGEVALLAAGDTVVLGLVWLSYYPTDALLDALSKAGPLTPAP